MDRDLTRQPHGAAAGGVFGALERFRRARDPEGSVRTLLRGIDKLDVAGAARRRDEVVSHAIQDAGLARVHAELIYDVASEEGLEPAFAVELVRSGIAVCGPGPEAPAPPDGTRLEGTPEWIAPAVVAETRPTVDVVRERRMRMSFRRLRGRLERHATPEAALAEFMGEPDVGDCGYLLD